MDTNSSSRRTMLELALVTLGYLALLIAALLTIWFHQTAFYNQALAYPASALFISGVLAFSFGMLADLGYPRLYGACMLTLGGFMYVYALDGMAMERQDARIAGAVTFFMFLLTLMCYDIRE